MNHERFREMFKKNPPGLDHKKSGNRPWKKAAVSNYGNSGGNVTARR